MIASKYRELNRQLKHTFLTNKPNLNPKQRSAFESYTYVPFMYFTAKTPAPTRVISLAFSPNIEYNVAPEAGSASAPISPDGTQ